MAENDFYERGSGSSALVSCLAKYAVLGQEDIKLLGRVPYDVAEGGIGLNIEPPWLTDFVYVVIDGILARYRRTQADSRQITGFFFKGDIANLEVPVGAGFGLEFIAASAVLRVRRSALDAIGDRPSIANVRAAVAGRDKALALEWLANIGGRPAPIRVAHLICEYIVRGAIECDENRFSLHFPLAQQLIGEACGISIVHVHRCLALLKQRDLIATSGKAMEVLDWPRLQAFAGFEPDYLDKC